MVLMFFLELFFLNDDDDNCIELMGNYSMASSGLFQEYLGDGADVVWEHFLFCIALHISVLY